MPSAVTCGLSEPRAISASEPGRSWPPWSRFDLKILGKGGHGAQPHLCVDAFEVGTQVVAALQRIVSRHTNPIEPAVVTVGTFNAGTAFNITPAEAVLSGTTRTFNEETWKSWEARIDKVVNGVCASMGAGYELTFSSRLPPDGQRCPHGRRRAALRGPGGR